jgi:hypothetical protein
MKNAGEGGTIRIQIALLIKAKAEASSACRAACQRRKLWLAEKRLERAVHHFWRASLRMSEDIDLLSLCAEVNSAIQLAANTIRVTRIENESELERLTVESAWLANRF